MSVGSNYEVSGEKVESKGSMSLRWLKAWLLVLLWASMIFYLSSIPGLGTGLGIWDLILRKCAHLAEYALLTILLWRALRDTTSGWSCGALRRSAMILAVLYAVSDEIHQGFVVTRVGSGVDVLIDMLGAACGLILWLKFGPHSARAPTPPR